MDYKTPKIVEQALRDNASSIAQYDFRSVAYRGKVYNITYSVNAGGYYATFMQYSSASTKYDIPVFLEGKI